MRQGVHQPSSLVLRVVKAASTGKFQVLGYGLLAVVSWVFILANLDRLWGLYRSCGPDGSGCDVCYEEEDMCEVVECESSTSTGSFEVAPFEVTMIWHANWTRARLQWALVTTLLYGFSLLLRVCEYTFLFRPNTGIPFYPKSRLACFGMVLVSLGCYNPHLLLDADRKAAIQKQQKLLSTQQSGILEDYLKSTEEENRRLGLSELDLDKDTAIEHAAFLLRFLIEGVVFVLNLVMMSENQEMTRNFSTDWPLLANCSRQVNPQHSSPLYYRSSPKRWARLWIGVQRSA